MECGVRSVKYKVWSVECTVKCGVWSAECGVESVECGVWRVKWEVWSVECGVRSVKCGESLGFSRYDIEYPGISYVWI